MYIDDRHSQPKKTYFGEDAIEKLLNDRIKEQCSKIIETEFSKLLVITNKDDEDIENSTKCWICKKDYEKGRVKVKDHYHITGKYKGSPDQECNLNLSLIKKNLCCVS